MSGEWTAMDSLRNIVSFSCVGEEAEQYAQELYDDVAAELAEKILKERYRVLTEEYENSGRTDFTELDALQRAADLITPKPGNEED